MQEISEKIKERVCEFIHERNKSGSVPCKNQRASCLQLIRVCDLTRIVNQVAEEYSSSEKPNKSDGWIPCSSGNPPQTETMYWVTYKWGDGSIHVCKDIYTDGGEWFETKSDAVLAWMPINDPAPYQPKGE